MEAECSASEEEPLASRRERPSVLITTYASSGRQRNKWASQGEPTFRQGEQRDQRAQDKQPEGQVGGKTNWAAELQGSTNLFSGQRARSHGGLAAKLASRDAELEGLSLRQIRGPSGSVRGHKDVVRKSLQNIRVVACSSGRRNFNSALLPTFMGSKGRDWLAPACKAATICNVDGAGDRDLLTCDKSQPTITCKRTNQTLLNEHNRLEYLECLADEEENQCVAYTTTLGVIRRTFEDSRLMKTILELNLINYEERDIYLNQEYKHQLRLRCESIHNTVPALFVDGQFLGGIKELELLNESGQLPRLLAKFKMSDLPREVCACCGGAKFIACQSCNGSRKSTIRHFKFSSIALRCIKCDKNDGLVQCPACCLSSAASTINLDFNLQDLDFNNNNNLENIKEKESCSESGCELGDQDLKQLQRL